MEICCKSPIDIYMQKRSNWFFLPRCSIWNSGYQYPPYRKDKNKTGDSKIVFIREGLIIKRLKAFEGDISETIYLELTVSKKLNS